MKRDLGDLLDRWSIAKLKATRVGLEEQKREYAEFTKELEEAKSQYKFDVQQWADYLVLVNDAIWQLESGLKSGKEVLPNPIYLLDVRNIQTLANVGVTSILIRNFNSMRVQFKNIVNKMVNEGFQDTKTDHLSSK